MIKKRRYPITTDNVKNLGGKQMILQRMVNHYRALADVKPKVDIAPPHPHIKKISPNLADEVNYKEEFHNVREAYKKVSNVKHYVDDAKPYTFDMKTKGKYNSCKEKYENLEHLRTLEAMSKRILSFGRPQERRKNKDDPIAHPTYFFRSPTANKKESDRVAKLISLNTLNERLKEANTKERNKMLLSNTVYETIGKKGNSNNAVNERAKSALKKLNRPMTTKNKKSNYFYDMDPEKYIMIHTNNRMFTGKRIVEEHKRQKELSSQSKSVTKIIDGKKMGKNIPVFEDDLNEFEEDIRQYILDNTLYKDEEFEWFTQKLIMKNKDKEGVTKEQIVEIVNKYKEALDEDDDDE